MPNNVTVLNVAEKPSVARALAQVFSRFNTGVQDRGSQRTGNSNQVFTHENVQFPDVMRQPYHPSAAPPPVQSHTMITTSVRGHLASQDFPSEFGWNKCDPLELLDEQKTPIETSYRGDMQALQQQLQRLSRQCTVVILWLDCDREGEAIGDEVRQVCLQAKRNLKVLRARFSTVLPQEIKKALYKLDLLNEHFVAAVQARSTLDLRVGAAFTRFQTLFLQRRFDTLSDTRNNHAHGNNNNNNTSSSSVISYGPCQFPTLGFVVERWARIETFVPEDFWYLDLSIQVGAAYQQGQQQRSTPIHFTWKKQRVYDQVACLVIYEECLEAGEAVVTSLQGRPKNKWRPVPLATVELQKRASRYLRIGSETLMTAAEELYQHGYISYPRTETEKFRPEFGHRPLIQQFANLNNNGQMHEFGTYANKLLNQNAFQIPRAGQHDDQAHPPITPCKAVDPSEIQDATQRNVYKLVVKHYLACCSRDAIGRETELTVRIGAEDFSARGLMVLEKNWLEIYEPYERWSTGQGELPPLEIGSRIVPTSFLMKDGRTAPPQPISEVELISLMDRHGIGTDATIAQHISTIQDRDYASKNANQKFLPTKLGIALVEGYNSMGYQLNKPDLRRETEAECNAIAAGHKSKDDVVQMLLAKMRECFITARFESHKLEQAVARHFPRIGSSNETLRIIQANFSECGRCQSMMSLKQERGRGGNQAHRRKVLYCATCRIGYSLPRGIPHPKFENDGSVPTKCPICNFQAIKVERGDGYQGNGYHVCPSCFSSAPQQYGGGASNSDFRCFQCTHPTCTLASGTRGSDLEVFPCPFCPAGGSGKITLRKNSRGHILSCSNYSRSETGCNYTIWLPKEAESVSVPGENDENHLPGEETVCGRCSVVGQKIVRKVAFSWKAGSVPPSYGRQSFVCVLCDVNFRNDLGVSLPRQGAVSTNGRHLNQGHHHSNSRGGSGNQQRSRTATGGSSSLTCFKCGQPGHFANQCPSR